MEEWTSGSVIALAAGSSVLAALLTQGLSSLRDWKKRKEDSGFALLYLALALESYANTCSDVISESELWDDSSEHAGSPQGNIPELPEYPANIEWKTIGIEFTTDALSFRVDIEARRTMFTGEWEFGDEDTIVPDVRLEAARFGKEALRLAAEFRKSRKIAAAKYLNSEWNVPTHLDDTLQKYTKRLEDRRKSEAELLEKLNATVPAIVDPEPNKAI